MHNELASSDVKITQVRVSGYQYSTRSHLNFYANQPDGAKKKVNEKCISSQLDRNQEMKKIKDTL